MFALPRLAVLVAITLAVSAIAGPGLAAPIKYTSKLFLGDSLSDPGNLFALTGGLVPESPPYFEGRRSNGPVWAEHVARDFADKGLSTQNVAHAFANAVTNDDEAAGLPLQIPDLPQQIEMLDLSPAVLGARPIASLFFGANDIFGAIAASAALPAADAAANVAASAAAAATAVAGGIIALTGAGIGDFLVFNLPALDQTPAFNLLQPQAAPLAQLGTSVFNTVLAQGISALAGTANIISIDTFTLFNQLLADPGAFGVANATVPCIIPGVSICAPEQADLLAFFDPVHPNRVVHEAIADVVRVHVAPVPLPLPGLLLAGGLVLLAGLRRARG